VSPPSHGEDKNQMKQRNIFPNFISTEILDENSIKCFTLKLVNATSTKLFFLFFLTTSVCSAQKQLVFLQHDNVIARFTEGDRFKFKLKNRQWKEGYIYELTDFSLITSGLDTIPFLSIDKISVKKQRRASFTNRIGGAMLIGGLGYIVIDQVNVLVGSTKSGFDSSDQTALIIAGAGALMALIKPKYKRVSRGVAIRAIDYRSLYYKSNP
jgi:hypothetical protein